MTLTSRQLALIDVAAEIAGEPDPDSIEFLHVALAQAGLPYRDLGAQRDYVRENGRVSLIVTAGHHRDATGRLRLIGLPYGPKPRLLMLHLCSEAVRLQSATIPVSETMTGFMRDLGLDVTGPAIRMFKEQLGRLAVARLQIRMLRDDRETVINVDAIRSFDVWFGTDGRQHALWPSEVTLSAEFFDSLRQHALPLDPRAIRALKHSARALDVYTWLATRLHRVRPGRTFVSWPALHAQFGPDQRDDKAFKRRFTEALRQALAVYPRARIERVDGGLVLHRSPPPISAR